MALNIQLIITHFDNIRGPIIAFSVPEGVSTRIKEVLEKLLDVQEQGYFEHVNKSGEQFSTANHTFFVDSEWGRGNVEILMLSLITDEGQKPEIFQSTLENYVSKSQKIKKLFKGFYLGSNKSDAEIQKFSNKIISLVRDCYEECKRNPEGQKAGIMTILGVQSVGKTSILNILTENKFQANIKPTLGTQIIRSVVDNFNFKIYDVGGQARLRKNWFSVPKPNAIIYVLDASANEEQHKESKEEFDKVVNHYFGKDRKQVIPQHTPILILANKSDLNTDFTEKDVRKILKPSKDLNIKIGVCSAIEKTGITESFKWLVKEFLFV